MKQNSHSIIQQNKNIATLSSLFWQAGKVPGVVAAMMLTIGSMVEISAQVLNKADTPNVESTIVDEAEAQQSSLEEMMAQLTDEELVELLGDEEYRKRSAAHQYIWGKGQEMKFILEQATQSDQPEIAMRSADILRFIRIGLTGSTPKHITDKIIEFQTANLSRKEEILDFFNSQKSYDRMLFLLWEMDDREGAADLHDNFKGLPHRAARAKLATGDVSAAIELLKISPQSEDVLRSLAFIYAKTGRAKTELNRMNEIAKKSDADVQWMLMLHQEIGDRVKLMEFAKQYNIKNIVAVLKLLEGDPSAVVNMVDERPNIRQAKGLKIIKGIYEGESYKQHRDLHQELLNDAELNAKRKNYQSTNLLFMTGGEALAEKIIIEHAPNYAFEYLSDRERPAEALAVLGLKDQESLIRWSEDLTASLFKKREDENRKNQGQFEDSDSINPEQNLLRLAKFYSFRGENETSKLILNPFLSEIYKTDKERWHNFVADLPRDGMEQVAMDIILSTNEDEDLLPFVKLLFDDSSFAKLFLDEFSKRKTDDKANFKDLATMFGMYRGTNQKIKQLTKYLLDSAENQGPNKLIVMKRALYDLTDYRNNSIAAQKYITQFIEDAVDEEARNVFIYDQFLIARDNLDWPRLSQLFKDHSNFFKGAPEWLTIHSIAEREQGNEKLANELLDNAMLMTAGLPNSLQYIYEELNLMNNHALVRDLLERNLIINSDSLNDRNFTGYLGALANYDSPYLQLSQWKKASAVSYAGNYITMNQLSSRLVPSSILIKMNYVLNFSRGMYFHDIGEHAKAKRLLDNANNSSLADGGLADIFYPAVMKTQYKEELEDWVNQSHEHLQRSLSDFPNSGNTHNTLAWLLSRSVTKLDLALEHSERSLELRPDDPAHVDTMAEVWFAKGDRKKAVEWGERAVRFCRSGQIYSRKGGPVRPFTLSLYGQLTRFKKAELPKR